MKKKEFLKKKMALLKQFEKKIIKILHDIQRENNDDDRRHFETGRP